MSRKTLFKFWIAASILGALLVTRHGHAERQHLNRYNYMKGDTCIVRTCLLDDTSKAMRSLEVRGLRLPG